VQRDPKVLLAYSSIAKMGLMSAVLGLVLSEPTLAPGLTAVIALYAAHHGLAKGALFLGVGVLKSVQRSWMIVLLALPALVIAGAPLTSGAVLKESLVLGMQSSDSLWVGVLMASLPVLGLTTVLLMGRFLYLVHGMVGHADPLPLRFAWHWFVLVAVALLLPLGLNAAMAPWSSLWPLLLGGLVAALTWAWRPACLARLVGAVEPGDLFHLLLRAWRSVRRHWQDGKAGPAIA
jgi:hydrogenase-4 component B